MTRLSLLAAAALAAGCSSTPVLQSTPAAPPPVVDGSEADWADVLRPVEGHAGIALGVRDAADAFYVVAVLRGDGPVRNALSGGLTLWLDPEGGTDRALGVRFPLGAGGRTGPRPTEGRGALDAREAIRDLEVLRDGATTGSRLPATSTTGLQAAATLEAGVLVVEYRIPRGAGANGLEVSGDAIGLGLTTPERSRADRPQGGRGERGGRGGAGGGRGGAQGSRPAGGDRAERSDPLDVWVQVDLTSSLTATSPGSGRP